MYYGRAADRPSSAAHQPTGAAAPFNSLAGWTIPHVMTPGQISGQTAPTLSTRCVTAWSICRKKNETPNISIRMVWPARRMLVRMVIHAFLGIVPASPLSHHLRCGTTCHWRCRKGWFSAEIASSVLPLQALDALADFLVSNRNVTVLTGAGASTESCIPDYRGPRGAYSTGVKNTQSRCCGLSRGRQNLVARLAGRTKMWHRCSAFSQFSATGRPLHFLR